MITIGIVDILLGSIWLYIYGIDKSNKLVLYNAIVFICTGIINVVLGVISVFIYNTTISVIRLLSTLVCLLCCLRNLIKMRKMHDNKQISDQIINRLMD